MLENEENSQLQKGLEKVFGSGSDFVMPEGEESARLRDVFERLIAHQHSLPWGQHPSMEDLRRDGVFSADELALLGRLAAAPPQKPLFSGPGATLNEILGKITVYQSSLPEDRPVELEELKSSGALSADDLEFLASHSVTYKPHRMSDYHCMDMLEMPTDDGCIFVGPAAAPSKKRRAKLREFGTILENFLMRPGESQNLLMHVEFARDDGMGIAPGLVTFILKSPVWTARIPAICETGRALGPAHYDDREIQGIRHVSFATGPDPGDTAAFALALLREGCGFEEDAEICYSAGALDQDEAGMPAPD